MQCYVYRSRRKQQTYLFLPKRDDFTQVPASLLKLFGEAEFSFEFELSSGRKMVLAEASEVQRNIQENGFYLQLPPGEEKAC
ncbi:MAG: YcgL domain-containing protein [Thiothrix sp.]|nr:MAG: YcgL domain-containing protein [Thiothrix sp.]